MQPSEIQECLRGTLSFHSRLIGPDIMMWAAPHCLYDDEYNSSP